jgi:hypothetical protein
MRIAVTDACIFIDIIELGLAELFFNLHVEIHTTLDVINELYPSQQQVLDAHIDAKKLTVHCLAEEEMHEMSKMVFSKSLSQVDRTVLFLAKKIDAIVISSDKLVRNYAKGKSIEYHGMLWVFDELVKYEFLSRTSAAVKLKELISMNAIYQNNKTLMEEFFLRLHKWGNDSIIK